MGSTVLGANRRVQERRSTSPAPALVRATPSCRTSVASPCVSLVSTSASSRPASFTLNDCTWAERWPQVISTSRLVVSAGPARPGVASMLRSRANAHTVRNRIVARLNASVISRNRVAIVNQHALRTVAGLHRLCQKMNGSRQPISGVSAWRWIAHESGATACGRAAGHRPRSGNPKGIVASSPRLRGTSYLGSQFGNGFNRNAVAANLSTAAFQSLHPFGLRDGASESREQMHVVFHAADADGRAIQLLGDAAEIRMERVASGFVHRAE